MALLLNLIVMKRCPQCGKDHPDELTDCPETANPPPPPIPSTPSQSKANPLLFLVIGAAVVGSIAAAVFAYEYSVIRSRKLASEEISCGLNIKGIEGTKAIWMLEKRKTEKDTPTDSELFTPGNFMQTKPQCPSGGIYRIGACSEAPACSIHLQPY